MAADPDDPTTWSEPQQRVLRWVAAEGGWCTDWPGAPGASARRTVEDRTGVQFQREHPLGEAPWYQPLTAAGRQKLAELAAKLPPADGPWSG